MRRSARWGLLLLLALVTVGWLGAESSAILAAEASQRADTWEFTFPVRYFNGNTLDFDGGTKIRLGSDLGWGFGFGYNFSEKVEMTFDFAWMNMPFDVDYANANGTTVTASGDMDVSSTQVNFIYNFMPKTITPYVSGGFGWGWVDTNIPTGHVDTGCYWDPWYGYICYNYQNTFNKSGFNYGLGLGVRIEPKENFYFQIGLNDNWQDWGSHAGNDAILSYRLQMGWKF